VLGDSFVSGPRSGGSSAKSRSRRFSELAMRQRSDAFGRLRRRQSLEHQGIDYVPIGLASHALIDQGAQEEMV
jgi:hypothetical protein